MYLLTVIVCDQWQKTAKQDLVVYCIALIQTYYILYHYMFVGAYKIKLQRIGSVYTYTW